MWARGGVRALELLYIALTLACSRTSVCIGFLVGTITITVFGDTTTPSTYTIAPHSTKYLCGTRPTSVVRFLYKRSTWSSETALGSCSSYVALIRRGDSSLFEATPVTRSKSPVSGRTSSNKSAPRTYIVASANDGK